MSPHKVRTALLALAVWSLSIVATLLLGWLALALFAQNTPWAHFAKEFAAELTLMRALVFAGLLVGWVDCLKRAPDPQRRVWLMRAGLAVFICILLIEINRFRG